MQLSPINLNGYNRQYNVNQHWHNREMYVKAIPFIALQGVQNMLMKIVVGRFPHQSVICSILLVEFLSQ